MARSQREKAQRHLRIRSQPALVDVKWLVCANASLQLKRGERRIVAAVCDPETLPAEKVGFENHVNVFHRQKTGLDSLIAKGLAVYLNSTLVDLYFRQFSGHTQVNATDLRTLRYPSLDALARLGAHVNGLFPNQAEVDALLEVEIERLDQNDSST